MKWNDKQKWNKIAAIIAKIEITNKNESAEKITKWS